ncbi:heat shock protein DDB_G0288861-like isoform X2 [Anopheles funestus]|uniref:heat shock protein DDB_G0288861-like isoform X2 n=1 Tax=Anopheles funestus TaxID=62324 RepID=UPI0020C64618|nr:heat shock protein DDB_G0288861-like isoform X2 [Anopheles funestus]
MRVKTLRQIKNQRGHRNHHHSSHHNHNHVAANAAIDAHYFSPERLNALVNCMNPPYRMPPQPLGAYGMQHDHHSSIPGTASTEAHVLATPLRTHSSKFPIERELILSSNKNSSKIPLMQDNRNTSIPALLNRSATSAIGPDLPVKQTQAWNQPQMDVIHTAVSGSMPRTIVRFPEDVTALADRDGSFSQREKDSTTVKKSVTKTYHTLKDLISSKFKKDANEQSDELNNVTSMLHGHQSNLEQGQSSSQQQQQQQQHGGNNQTGSYMYSSASDNNLLQAQSNLNVWPSSSQSNSPLYYHKKFSDPAEGFTGSKALSQPQLNIGVEQSNRNAQHVVSMLPAPVDGTDSDDGGFRQHSVSRQTNQSVPNGASQSQAGGMQTSRSNTQQPAYIQNYRHNHAQQQQQQQQHLQQQHHMSYQQALHNAKQRAALEGASSSSNIQTSSYNTTVTVGDQSTSHLHHHHHLHHQGEIGMQKHTISVDINSGSSVNISTGESHDAGAYDKNGNHSSNIDSGRGSSSMATASADAVMEKSKVKSDGEWIDVVDVELRNILEPGMKSMNLRPESTMSESASSMSPPLPPLSPHEAYNQGAGPGSSNIQTKPNNNTTKLQKQEYGTDTYNRASKNPQPIGPSKGQPSPNTIQNYMNHLKLSSNKKHEQNALKKHLFGLDTDVASVTNTTRSLDLESLLGGPWDGAQSVSESETDGGGLQQIRNQLEGLETMYSEVLKMLGNRMATNESTLRANRRRRHGSMSSLPSSSISGRPIRDRRRLDERRKVRDIKGINKRFQRLESHVVTLARSVAHLSSEMRSQHLVSQELEELRNDLALLRSQSMHNLPLNSSGNGANASAREPINLTNPKRVKKLTKFFGEDPPLMKLFLKKLGYEKYAPIFESERVGMIELPYLGEERLQKMGIPLGPRLRILQEAQISLCRDTTLCIV